MTDREFLRKMTVVEGKGLSIDETRRLDAELNRSEFLADAVKSLPEDTLSLAWRSELNERLFAEAAAGRRSSRRLWVWRPALGLALAGALALAIYLPGANEANRPSPTLGRSSVESQMANAHVDAVNALYVAGHGLAAYEATPTAEAAPNVVRWDESDLGDF